jgi:endonuclease III
MKKLKVLEDRPRQGEPAEILAGLDLLYPDAHCELDFKDAWQALVATILSAQCTDVRVNLVTPELFERWPTAKALSTVKSPALEAVIKSTGFYRNKAKSLIGAAKALTKSHDGVVPRTMAEMIKLPGVARKTANVVLGSAYGIASGVVVDTHVARLSVRLGLSAEEDPVKIERDLMRVIPEERWVKFGHQIVWHGRRVCAARKPRCAGCPLPCPSRAEPEAAVD